MTAIRKRQGSCFYLCKKNAKTFIYKNSYTLQKARQFPLRLYVKSKTLYVTQFFMKILNLAFIYKNHDTLRYVKLLYI